MALAVPTLASAQTTTAGTVRDGASGGVVAGAVVALIDSAGKATDRTLTDREGRFELRWLESAARVTIRAIGFAPREIAVADSLSFVRAIAVISLDRIPPVLQTVTTVAGRIDATSPCPRGSDSLAAQSLWDQARIGLQAVVVGMNARRGEGRMLGFDRLLNAQGHVVRATLSSGPLGPGRTFGGPSARPPAELARSGYLHRVRGGMLVHGPDVDVLLDSTFNASHCFTVARGDDRHPGEIGLAFAPARGRAAPTDVRGTLWMRREPFALRSVEFEYVGDGTLVKLGRYRGRLVFRAMPNGIVVVDEWSLFLPLLSRREVGGILQEIRWPDGTTYVRAAPPVSGRIVDPRTGTPRAGLHVSLPRTPFAAVTNDSGGFVFHGMLPGPYSVLVQDSAFAPLGIVETRRYDDFRVDSVRGASLTLELEAPVHHVKALCEFNVGDGEGVVVVQLRDSLGRPVRTPVTFGAGSSAEAPHRARQRTVTEPRMVICGIPRGTLSISAVDQRVLRSAKTTRDITGELRVDTLTLTLRRGNGSGRDTPPPAVREPAVGTGALVAGYDAPYSYRYRSWLYSSFQRAPWARHPSLWSRCSCRRRRARRSVSRGRSPTHGAGSP